MLNLEKHPNIIVSFFKNKLGLNFCHFLGIGALEPFLDRNYFPFVSTPIPNEKIFICENFKNTFLAHNIAKNF